MTQAERVIYDCPQCGRQIHLALPVMTPTASGACLIDGESLARGFALHIRFGCDSA